MKYVIVEECGFKTPIIFGDIINHSTFKNMNPISAGFVSIKKDNNVVCYGRSETLNMSSGLMDAGIIEASMLATKVT